MSKKSQSPLPAIGKKSIEKEMSFLEALTLLIGGKKIRRSEWNDKEEYCLLQDSFLRIHRDEKFHNWIVSEGDMLALDWEIL